MEKSEGRVVLYVGAKISQLSSLGAIQNTSLSYTFLSSTIFHTYRLYGIRGPEQTLALQGVSPCQGLVCVEVKIPKM